MHPSSLYTCIPLILVHPTERVKDQMTVRSINEQYITDEDLKAVSYGTHTGDKKPYELASPL